MTHAILTDDEFVGSRAAIVNTPVEWLVGVIRTLRVSVDTPARLKMVDATLRALGQRPFYPPDVGGWPHGRVWMSTASADVRMRAASQLARAGDLSSVEDAAADDRIDAVGYLIGVGAWSDRTVDGAEAVGAQAGSAGRRSRQHARIPDVIASADA